MDHIHLGTIKKGQILVEKDEKINFLLIVKTGKIEKLDWNLKLIEVLKPGDCLGEIPIFYRKHWQFTYKVQEDSELWCLEKRYLKNLLS